MDNDSPLDNILQSLIHFNDGVPLKRLSSNTRAGERKSYFFGDGLDFYRTRRFDPMRDDIRKVMRYRFDPNNGLMVREARLDKDINTIFIADLSSSIWSGSIIEGGLSNKEWLLLWVLGSLGITVSSIQDKVSFVGYDDKLIIDMLPKGGKGYVYHALGEFFNFLSSLDDPYGRKFNINNALDFVQGRHTKPGFIFVISDFINNEDIHRSLLLESIVARHEVVFIILDDLDSLPTRTGLGWKSVKMWDVETKKYKLISLRKIRKIKKDILKKRESLRKGLTRIGVDSAVVSRNNYENAIAELIEKRKQ